MSAAPASAASSRTHLTPTRWQDSKAFGWLLENGCVWTLCYLRSTLIPEPETVKWVDENGKKVPLENQLRVIAKNMAISYAQSVATEVGTVYTLKLIDMLFFQHVPHFTVQQRSHSPFTWNALKDWLAGNWWLQWVAGSVVLGLCESFLPERFAKEIKETKFDLVRFLRNMTVFRFVVDIVFYLGHRLLHVNDFFYQYIHRRHHEHFSTNLRTNWHFGAIDLFIESALPIGAGMAVLRFLLGVKMGRFELHLLQQYVAWHESGTHMGKPLQLISQYAPLSVFYNVFFPQIDSRGIYFHETHHNRRDCNYGITQWLDALAGTREFTDEIVQRANAARSA